ncbi:MAG: redox-sensing transcriptional repressor Rex [Chloroflexi bacterium]|jgi:redox-sensing transcriptional repressor|nr:redox-sensing transcriptional repressor Rex [Chloroflexota bacterium]
MSNRTIPDIVVGRLPRYLQALLRMLSAGETTTSSKELGEKLGISAAQIRKDLSQFGEFGKQGTGYHIPYLIDQLQNILKVNRVWDIVLVGAGDLGHAIAHYQGFANHGFCISMLFDNDPAKIGAKISEFIVQDSRQLIPLVKQAGIKVAMLTVPPGAAQSVAEELVQAGVTAILNYTPMPLNLPKHIKVQNIDPIIQLQHMTYYLD